MPRVELDALEATPEYGVLFMRHGTEYTALLVLPRSSVHPSQENLLDANVSDIAWVSPYYMSRTGKVWRGHGWFPMTVEDWERLSRAYEVARPAFARTRRERDAVAILERVLEEAIAPLD
jgi:hypothetical protein